MNSIRKTSIIVGVLYIIALTSAMFRSVLLDSILDTPGYLDNLSANESDAIIGVLLFIIMGAAIPSIAITIYPIIKQQNIALALGYVVATIIESVLYVITTIAILTLLTLSKQYVEAGVPDNAHYQILGTLLITVRDWTFNILWPITVGLAALIFYYLLYQSKLIPGWLSNWGFVGAALSLAGGLLSFFGFISTLSVIYNYLLLQIALQEMVMAVWLIVKGFNTQVQEHNLILKREGVYDESHCI